MRTSTPSCGAANGATAQRAAPGSPSCQISQQLNGCTTKRRFSELTGEAVCNQEYVGGLEQRLDDEAEPVVAQRQAPVFQDPGIAAFDRPAPLAQSRPTRLTTLVNARLGPKGAAQLAMMLSVVAFVGEYRADAGHDREGSQEQPLEDKRVIDIGGGREAGDRHALAIGGNVVFGASLGPIGRIGTGQIATALGPHRAGIEDQVGMAAQHGGQQRVYLRQQSRFGPARQNPAQGRSTGLIRGGPQTAPGRPLTQKAPQCRYNPDSFGQRVARATA